MCPIFGGGGEMSGFGRVAEEPLPDPVSCVVNLRLELMGWQLDLCLLGVSRVPGLGSCRYTSELASWLLPNLKLLFALC